MRKNFKHCLLMLTFGFFAISCTSNIKKTTILNNIDDITVYTNYNPVNLKKSLKIRSSCDSTSDFLVIHSGDTIQARCNILCHNILPNWPDSTKYDKSLIWDSWMETTDMIVYTNAEGNSTIISKSGSYIDSTVSTFATLLAFESKKKMYVRNTWIRSLQIVFIIRCPSEVPDSIIDNLFMIKDRNICITRNQL